MQVLYFVFSLSFFASAIIQMYTIEKSKEYEYRKREENEKIKMGRGGEESKREKDGGPGGNFLKEIEKTALSSSTIHGRIAARKVMR